jgi:hypothetical protein
MENTSVAGKTWAKHNAFVHTLIRRAISREWHVVALCSWLATCQPTQATPPLAHALLLPELKPTLARATSTQGPCTRLCARLHMPALLNDPAHNLPCGPSIQHNTAQLNTTQHSSRWPPDVSTATGRQGQPAPCARGGAEPPGVVGRHGRSHPHRPGHPAGPQVVPPTRGRSARPSVGCAFRRAFFVGSRPFPDPTCLALIARAATSVATPAPVCSLLPLAVTPASCALVPRPPPIRAIAVCSYLLRCHPAIAACLHPIPPP